MGEGKKRLVAVQAQRRQPVELAGLGNIWIEKATCKMNDTMFKINSGDHPLMRRKRKAVPKTPRDRQDRVSVVRLATADFDRCLDVAVDRTTSLMRLAPVEVFEARPLASAHAKLD